MFLMNLVELSSFLLQKIGKISLLVILCLVAFAQQETLIEDFNTLQFQSNNWNCQGSTSQIVYDCPSGMSLMKLNQTYQRINKVITDILPHNLIQVYIDFYPIRTQYNEDYAEIFLDNQNVFMINKGSAQYYYHCSGTTNLYKPSTTILSIPHTKNQIDISFKMTSSSQYNNGYSTEEEGYTFRNFQIIYQRCYKSCKTCSSSNYNICLTCYTSIPSPQNSQCETCQQVENQRFLLHNSGCVAECPTGYDYKTDFICQKSQYQLYLSQYNTNSPIINQDLEEILFSSIRRDPINCDSKQYQVYSTNQQLFKNIFLNTNVFAIRIRASFQFFSSQEQNQNVQILFDDLLISSISLKDLQLFVTNGIILKVDKNYKNCQSKNTKKLESRIEIIQVVNKLNFQIKFRANQQFDNSLSWSVTNLILEQIICSLNCLECQNYLECNQCENTFYLHKGQNNDPQNSKTKYLLKEFHDLSTTKERISQLFTLISNSANNFAKGTNIYFSYLPEKRVFGGSLVWVDAQFKFNLNIPKYASRIRIKFQVILGDDFEPGQFSYKINNLSDKILTKSTSNPIQNQQIWGNIQNEYILQVDEYLDFDSFSNLALEIIFTCSNPTKSVDQAFCALQNFFITAIYNCPIEYKFDLYEYYEGRNPCIPICGDGKVVGQEQCDDGNQLPYDGCYNCVFECKESCIYCVHGYCLRDVNYKSDLDIFFSINQTIYYQQQNQIEQHFIYQQNCQLECEICINYNCLRCFDGYYLNIDQQCQSICGDSRIVGKEECDDGNDFMHDNCVKCQLIMYNKCPQHCSFCYQGECQQCKYGFTLNNNECQQICGDNLINKEIVNNQQVEQCDNAESEGCVDCVIQPGYICLQIDQSICWTCHEKCKTCIATQNTILECKECIEGYYPIEKECLKCDDNCITCKNQKDMCTSCYREDCQKCEETIGLQTNEKLRICEAICGDGIVIQFYEQCDDGNDENGDGCDEFCILEMVEEPVKFEAKRINGDLSNDISIEGQESYQIYCQNITVTIEGFLKEEFDYDITVSDQSCKLQFQFFKSILKVNKIHVFMSYSETQKRIINFPTYNELNQPDCDYYVKSPQRFLEKGVDPLFINNAQVPFYFILFSVVLYTLTFILQQFFEFILKSSMKHQYTKQNHFSIFCVQQEIEDNQQEGEQIKVKVEISYNKVVKKILIKLTQLTDQFRSKIKQTVTLCSLDITMAISLQFIYANQQDNIIININNVLAFLFTTLLFYQLSQTYYVIGIHKSLAQNPKFQLKYGCFYENINVENSFGFKFNFVGLIRKIIYIFSTTYFYYSPLLQTSFCFLSCVSGVFLLIYSNPFETKRQFIKQLISESGLSIIVLITVIFSIDDQINKIDDQSKTILGWIIIYLVGVCVLNELLTVIYEIIKMIYQKFKLFINELNDKKQQQKDRNTVKVENLEQNISQQINLSRMNSNIITNNQQNYLQSEIEFKNQSNLHI